MKPGQSAQLERILEKFLKTFTRLGDQRGKAACLHRLGRLKTITGLHADSQQYFQRALKLLHRGGDHSTRGACYLDMGSTAMAMGQRDQAAVCFSHAVRCFQKAELPLGVAKATTSLVEALDDGTDDPQLLTLLVQALDNFVAAGHITESAACLLQLGDFHMRSNRTEAAQLCYQHAETYANLAADKSLAAQAQERSARVDSNHQALIKAGQDLLKEGRGREGILCLRTAARQCQKKGMEDEAVAAWKEALSSARKIKDYLMEAEISFELGQQLIAQNKLEEAVRLIEVAYDSFLERAAETRDIIVETATLLAQAYVRMNNPKEAYHVIAEITEELRERGIVELAGLENLLANIRER